MKKSRKIALLIMLATAFVMLAGVLLYRYFIGSRIQDGGRMENPDAYRAGKELIEFRWQQTHTNSSRCFTMYFYLENDLPVLTGRFMSPDGGEMRENGRDASSTPIPWQLTWVQWFELQNTLAEAALPAYEKPSQDAAEEAGSEICIVWRTEDGERSEKCSGENAAALEALVLRIAEEACRISQLEAGLPRPAPKGGWAPLARSAE